MVWNLLIIVVITATLITGLFALAQINKDLKLKDKKAIISFHPIMYGGDDRCWSCGKKGEIKDVGLCGTCTNNLLHREVA